MSTQQNHPHHTARRTILVAGCAAAALVLAACSSASEDKTAATQAKNSTFAVSSASNSPTDDSAATSSGAQGGSDSAKSSSGASNGGTTSSAGAEPDSPRRSTDDSQLMAPLTTADKTSPASEGTQLIPIKMRTGSHEGFDRFVVEFEGRGTAGWHAALTPNPGHMASGLPVKYEGSQAISLTVDRTPTLFNNPKLQERALKPSEYHGAGIITGVQYVTQFEAQSQFVIGLKHAAPYGITYLQNPPRLVIDVQNKS